VLDQEALKVANDRIVIEIGEQNRRVSEEISKYKAQMAGRGVLRSGAAVVGIRTLCADAIKNRALLVWQILHRSITTAGISYSSDLGEELKEVMASHMPVTLGDIKGCFKENIEMLTPEGPLRDKSMDELDRSRIEALEKVHTEIDLFILSLKRRAEMSDKESAGTVINVYSPTGAIQTGPHSIAYVSQTIDSEVREKVLHALEEVQAFINDVEDLPEYPKNEILDLVLDGKLEVQEDKPNLTKLRSLLSTVGTSIQMMASAKPAYELLKGALCF